MSKVPGPAGQGKKTFATLEWDAPDIAAHAPQRQASDVPAIP